MQQRSVYFSKQNLSVSYVMTSFQSPQFSLLCAPVWEYLLLWWYQFFPQLKFHPKFHSILPQILSLLLRVPLKPEWAEVSRAFSPVQSFQINDASVTAFDFSFHKTQLRGYFEKHRNLLVSQRTSSLLLFVWWWCFLFGWICVCVKQSNHLL